MVRSSLHMMAGMGLLIGAAMAAAPVQAQQACDPVLVAETSAGAMARLTLSSTCHAGQDVIIHHNGLMISETLDDTGMLMLGIPALTETALFMAEFVENGQVAVATTEVPSLAFYDRVALQWEGDSGLELHALEFGADYMTDDHVWRDAPKTMDRAALGEGGFLVPLGKMTPTAKYMAEVYTFPSATVSRTGNVMLSVEAVVGEGNCDSNVAAQTIQVKSGGDVMVKEVDLSIPDCDSVGDLVLLDGLVDDLKIGNN